MVESLLTVVVVSKISCTWCDFVWVFLDCCRSQRNHKYMHHNKAAGFCSINLEVLGKSSLYVNRRVGRTVAS